MSDPIECALDLMRRLPPQKTEGNLLQLIDLVPHLHEDIINAVDQPLKIGRCKKEGKDYILCAFNKDGESYRSPWSNKYDPYIDDAIFPSSRIRKLEVAANEAFNTYREMYYEVGDGVRKMKGVWDSIHVFKANERGRKAQYKLTSTVMLYTITNKSDLGNMNLSGSMTRQFEAEYPFDDPSAHIANIGRMVEDIELKMRNLLQEVYFSKTKDIVNGLRSVNSLIEAQKQMEVQKELVGKLLERKA
ncbi:13603_t:CDS:2 [Entrophospora sp. SA101]|nr:13603_t:CDS:2 [Entrophospora sp. SA101]